MSDGWKAGLPVCAGAKYHISQRLKFHDIPRWFRPIHFTRLELLSKSTWLFAFYISQWKIIYIPLRQAMARFTWIPELKIPLMDFVDVS